jgi:hypothetical protein
MLLATALWAAHAEHPTATDLALQAMLVLFIGTLLANVVVSVVAILRERQLVDPPEAGPLVAEQAQRPAPPAPPPKTPATRQAPAKGAPGLL